MRRTGIRALLAAPTIALTVALALCVGVAPQGALAADATDVGEGMVAVVDVQEGDPEGGDGGTVATPEGWQEESGKRVYWENGQKLTGIQDIDGVDYLFGADGAMTTGWGIDPASGSWCYADGSGALMTGWLLKGGSWYLLGSDHLMLTGWQQSGGSTYYLTDSGAMMTAWLSLNGDWYWLGTSGRVHTGWAYIDGSWYWLDPAQSGKAARDCAEQIGGTWYAFDAGCHMGASRWVYAGGSWYLAGDSGSLKAGWQYVGGAWYWMDPADARMLTGVHKIGSVTYLLTDSGAMATGWGRYAGDWYLTDASGSVLDGWQLLGSTWYYLDPQTHAMRTGDLALGEHSYYLSGSGAMVSNGWVTDSAGARRWFGSCGDYALTVSGLDVKFADGSTKDGLTKLGDAWYFLDQNVIQTGVQVIDDKTHQFDAQTGRAISGWQHAADGTWTRNDEQGLQQTGWVRDGSWYYLDPTTGVMRTGWVNLDGTWFYLDGSGAMRTGWLNLGGTWYLLADSGAMRTGWVWAGAWYYLDASGAMKTGWINLGGTWYYLDPSSGAMRTGWTWDGNAYYWLNDDGSLGNVSCQWQDMFQWAQSYYSSTNWLMLTDTSGCRTAIYYGHHGAWKPVKEWICSPGAPATPTVTGEFTVTGKGYSFGNGFTCYYYTQFYGDYLYHSVLYYQNSFRVMDGRLGMHLSHGCVRLDIDNAKWIYDNIPYGTKVVIW